MTALAPGSLGWLLAHEIRLTLREMIGKVRGGKRRGLAIVIFLGVMGLFVGGPLGLASRRLDLQPDAVTVALIGAAAFIAFTLMLSQTLGSATLALYQRGDLDLLFSSPLDPRRTLAVRITALAASCAWLMLLLVTPILLPAALIGGHWAWLAVYPTLTAIALLASAAGTALSMALFSVLGARRTRTVAQIIGAVIGALVFLSTQIHAILGGGRSKSVIVMVTDWARTHDLSQHPVFSLPARAALGEPVALAGVVTFAVLVFVACATGLGARFADHASVAIGATSSTPARARGRDAPVRYGAGPFGSLVHKEVRLVLRDPALISQVLMQILYLVPASLLLIHTAARSDNETLAPVAFGAGALVFLAGQLAGGLGWVTVSGEDARDLLRSAPLSAARIGQAKACAVLIMVLALVIGPLGVLAWFAPFVSIAALLGAAGSASSVALIEYWMVRPGKRSDFRHRQQSSGMFVTFAELIISALIGAATTVSIIFGAWGLIPAAVAGLMLFLLSLRARTDHD